MRNDALLLLSFVVCFACCGCGNDSDTAPSPGAAPSPNADTAQAPPVPVVRETKPAVKPGSNVTPDLTTLPGNAAKWYRWEKGKPPVELMHEDDGFAFLSGVGGDLLTAPKRTQVEANADGNWILGGSSPRAFIAGEAYAVPWLDAIERQVTSKEWKKGEPPLRKLIHQNDGFCVLTLVSGAFRGGGEAIHLQIDQDGYWMLDAKSQAPGTRARVTIFKAKQPGSFQGTVREHSWKAGQKPVRLIHSNDGFAVLAGVSGAFAGRGELVHVQRNEKDGYWYLIGLTGQSSLRAWAISIELPQAQMTAPQVAANDSAASGLTALPDSWKAHQSPIHSIDVSANGRWAVTGAKDGSVRVWKLGDASLVAELTGAADAIGEARLSSDGRWVAASVPGKQELRVWNLDPLKPGSAKEFHTFPNNDAGLLQVGLSYDGRTIVTGGNDWVRLYDTLQKKLRHSSKASAYASGVSPDGKTAVFGGWSKSIDLNDTAAWTRTGKLDGHAGHVYSLAFSADGQRLASGDGAAELRVWDIVSGNSLAVLHGHQKPIQRVALSRDGRRVLSWGEDAARVWDVNAGQQIFEVPSSGRPALSPDGNWLLTGDADGTVHTHRLPAAGGTTPPVIASNDAPSTIHGSWEIVEATEGGQKDDDYVGDVYVFSDDGEKFEIRIGGSNTNKLKFACKIDADNHQVEYSLPALKWLGLYQLEGDKLTLCLNQGERPAGFTSTADDDNRLLVLKRVAGTGGSSPGKTAASTPKPASPADQAIAALQKLGFEVSDDRTKVDIGYSGGDKIRDDDLVHLRSLPDVTRLDLYGAPLTDKGLQHLSGLKKLQRLRLHRSKITDEGLKVIGGLTNLDDLDLGDCESVTGAGLMHLKGLTKLRELSVIGVETRPGDLAFANDLLNLDTFYFRTSGDVLSESDIQVLGRLTKQTMLSLGGSDSLDNKTISHLSPLKSLTYLDLENTRVTDRALQTVKEFPLLRVLKLSGTKVDDPGMRYLAGMESLKELHLSGSRVGARGIASLADCPNLVELYLQGPETTDRHLAGLKDLKQLTRLYLDGDYDFREERPIPTRITLNGIRLISELEQLELLYLTDNPQITDEAVPYLSKLKNLRTLKLEGTSITPQGGRKIAGEIEDLDYDDLGL